MGTVHEFGPITIFRMGKEVLGKILYPVHSFLVGSTLIDTGSITAQKNFQKMIKNKPINAILITHSHEDHIGNLSIFQKSQKIPVYAHEKALPIIEQPKKLELIRYQKFMWGYPHASYAKIMKDEEIFNADGYEWKAIYTPGHAADHFCFFEAKHRWLFTGDLYLGKRILYLREQEDFDTILTSLKKVQTLDFDLMFCGLKGMIKNGKEALAEKIQNMEKLQLKVQELAQKGIDPRKITLQLLGKEDSMARLTSGDFSKLHVIQSILHLEKTK